MKKRLALVLSTLLIFGSGAAFATTPKLPPRHMTIGLLQLLCKKDGKSSNSSDQSGFSYCQGYLSGLIDSYFEREYRRKVGVYYFRRLTRFATNFEAKLLQFQGNVT